jgi:hypothetical protein
MENKKTIRNPFPWIGKVFKYEMKHLVRILMPVNISILAIALIAGLLIPRSADGSLDFSFSFSVNGNENGLSGFFFMIYWILVVVSAVVTISVIAKRFKNGLLGDEAYLNLTLPVTIGEHLWGRICSVIVWDLIYSAVMLISFVLVFIKNLNLINLGEGWQSWLFGFLLFDMTWSLCLILFIYLVNALGHLSKKHRTLAKLAAVIVIISLTSRLMGLLNFGYLNEIYEATTIIYWNALFGLILSAIYGTATYFILKLKLNLE